MKCHVAIAKVCYEVVRAYKNKDEPEWDEAPEQVRRIAIAAVEAAIKDGKVNSGEEVTDRLFMAVVRSMNARAFRKGEQNASR